MNTTNTAPPTQTPLYRLLRGFAFDPSLSLGLDTALINNVTYKVAWEDLEAGPKGEYLDVIDYDPSCDTVYAPVNLNDSYILAMNGLDPSEGNPQFHQQMVYAVAMNTIRNFELALGRKVLWSPQRQQDYPESAAKADAAGPQHKAYENYVPQLRIYPHALREANAYYSPLKKALLFGYFTAAPADAAQAMPGSLVFTCLSHDIIAHETTHALLDGMHTNYTIPSNPDVLAFHEAFADIVALFQHFTFPEVLRQQIARTRGDLESQNLLGELAQQFGKAIGNYGALRGAIGAKDENDEWHLKKPSSKEYQSAKESHQRGSILVAAIFEAFLAIYKARVSDLLRIYTNGTGVLPEGDLHPDLVNRLADEAASAAGQVLRMCVRALDYCPSVDITFGDYLRAIITADVDLVPDDSRNYRLAFIDAFRRRGIYPEGIQTLSVESLCLGAEDAGVLTGRLNILGQFFREFRNQMAYVTKREDIYNTTKAYIRGTKLDGQSIFGLHQRLVMKFDNSVEFEILTGLVFSDGWQALSVHTSKQAEGGPSFQVRALRLASRVRPDGAITTQIILSLMQRAKVMVTPGKTDDDLDAYKIDPCPDEEKLPEGALEFWGACTLIIDLDSLRLLHVIRKPLLDIEHLKQTGQKRLDQNRLLGLLNPILPVASQKRLDRNRLLSQYRHMFQNDDVDEYHLYFSTGPGAGVTEPFAFLHRAMEPSRAAEQSDSAKGD